jgi:predicted transcriptional regulator
MSLSQMVNESYEPTDDDEEVLDVLKAEERANPYLIREESGLSKQRINHSLQQLDAAGWVTKRTRGLYDFVDDPRDQ